MEPQESGRDAAPSGRLSPSMRPTTFVLLVTLVNAVLYHLPLFSFAAANLTLSSGHGRLAFATLTIALLGLTAIGFALLALVSTRLLKGFCMAAAIGNSIAVYFVATYHVVLDKTMMGNVQNTDLAETRELMHPALFACVLILGVLPALLLWRVRIVPSRRRHLAALAFAGFAVTLAWGYLASSTWGWFDKNSKKLGGMVMPWSYAINLGRYSVPALLGPTTQIPLPPATSASDAKTVVILVIGEAARAANFQLYGYPRPTNPLLSQEGVIALKNATACSTYTTASVRCILSHVDSGSEFSTRYEPLPSYLQRSGVDVIWRTHNFGEPPLKVQTYQKAGELAAQCTGPNCAYDEVLLTGLEERIRASTSRKVFVVLHQHGSHGPAYSTWYPPEFEYFKPVCKSVELGSCSKEELLNAYDNTIRYADYNVARTIDVLKRLQGTATLMIYLSDHGESLGEYGLYLHGTPWSIAPDFQKDIPFLVWMSDEFARQHGVQATTIGLQSVHSQRDIFHTVMGAFSLRSDAYQEQYDIFSPAFSNR